MVAESTSGVRYNPTRLRPAESKQIILFLIGSRSGNDPKNESVGTQLQCHCLKKIPVIFPAP
jgi:hypothetical protein